ILLIEDDPAQAFLLRHALAQMSPPHPELFVVSSGSAAMKFLRADDSIDGSPVRADLVLLPWHLPGMNGADLLEAIKADPALRTIPAIVFSCSESQADIDAAYRLGVNAFVYRPVELPDFVAAVKTIVEFWGRTVVLRSSIPA